MTQETRLRPGFLRSGAENIERADRCRCLRSHRCAGVRPLAAALVRCSADAALAVHTTPQRAMLRAAYVMPMTACRAAAAS
ncbi:hypothetical protein [Xanthomonas sp. SI]|uniref:hypothetical protein n=1 Tax=Xanthomonas sp. SI TaxID=2724123 RepID=UPI001639E537|nr:hypothetical protein [Xanthomonas sp. SI]